MLLLMLMLLLLLLLMLLLHVILVHIKLLLWVLVVNQVWCDLHTPLRPPPGMITRTEVLGFGGEALSLSSLGRFVQKIVPGTAATAG